jgi:hypothetical protein
MRHPRADVAVTVGSTVIGPGMAVLLPLPACCSGSAISPWTFSAFADRFADRYQTLRAGEEITISAAAAG